MGTIIEWNTKHNGVEIQTNDEHFVIDTQSSKLLTWDNAVRFYKNADGWTLPTKKQLQLVAEHFDEVNTLLKEHNGHELFGWHWSSDEHDEACAWGVLVNYGLIYSYYKFYDSYVRAVYAIQN